MRIERDDTHQSNEKTCLHPMSQTWQWLWVAVASFEWVLPCQRECLCAKYAHALHPKWWQSICSTVDPRVIHVEACHPSSSWWQSAETSHPQNGWSSRLFLQDAFPFLVKHELRWRWRPLDVVEWWRCDRVWCIQQREGIGGFLIWYVVSWYQREIINHLRVVFPEPVSPTMMTVRALETCCKMCDLTG